LKRTVIFCAADHVPTRVLGITQSRQETSVNKHGMMRNRKDLAARKESVLGFMSDSLKWFFSTPAVKE